MARPTLLLLVLAAAPALAAPGSAGAPRTLAARRAAVDKALARLDALVAQAKVPRELARIRQYRAYTPEQLADPTHGVSAEDILKFVENDELPVEIREEAAAALTWDSALRNDRDFDLQGRGLKRARAQFTLKVLPLLTDKDQMSRTLAKAICEGLWPGVKDDDIAACLPAKKDSCRAARTAWQKYISK